MHCAAPLVWSARLEAHAREWAAHLAANGCNLAHSNSDYGENIAAGTGGTLTPSSVVELWYGERAHYDFARGGFSMRTGHFTQLAWRTTTHLGCAVASCPSFDVYVCNYDPPGNVQGAFRENVLPGGCR
jgi:uncharacterized protein YkwD